jgi:hypothetical protein
MTMTTPTTQRKSTASSTRLDLETTRPSATTSALELAALACDVGLLVGVGTKAEVLDGLTGVLGSSEKEGVGSSREAGSDLVDGESLTTGLLDACASRGSEAESRDGELGKLSETDVVSDGADLITISVVLQRNLFRWRTMTMVLPSCAFAEYLLAAVATILDRLTAVMKLVNAFGRLRAFGGLTRAVDLGHHEASENNLVEGGIGTAYRRQHT